jgi:hypothetical protein
MRRARLTVVGAIGALLLGFASGGCSAAGPIPDEELGSRQDPIYGGTADTTHDAIMALLHIERMSAGSCTGTTIAKQGSSGILLTAAHCVVAIDASGNVVVPLQQDNPDSLEVVPGVDWIAGFDASKTFGVGEIKVHPQYDGTVDSPFDIAVVRYLGTTAATQVIPALSAAEDTLMIGTSVTLYGYGKTETNDNNTQRRKVDKLIQNLNAFQILYDQRDGKGSCQGDSGGPSIVQTPGGERVAATTSYGDQDCTQAGVSVRVSSAASFLDGVLSSIPAKLSCTDCRTASVGPMSPCFSQRAACAGNTPCGLFFNCAAPCQDSACYAACATKNPAGAKASDALAECECTTACATECANDTSCGGTPACGGLSVPGALCTTCIQQSCCNEAQACGADTACAACFRRTGTQCATNTLYNGLLGCLARCSGNPCRIAGTASTDAGAAAVEAGVASDGGSPAMDMPDGAVAVHYQLENPASAPSEGGCSCRQSGASGSGTGARGGWWTVGFAALAMARVRSRCSGKRVLRVKAIASWPA